MLPLALQLAIPAPGTESRAREFCTDWARLSEPQRFELLTRADRSETGDAPAELACRTARRPHVAAQLDYECRNWSGLMDFEVRAIIDRTVASCSAD